MLWNKSHIKKSFLANYSNKINYYQDQHKKKINYKLLKCWGDCNCHCKSYKRKRHWEMFLKLFNSGTTIWVWNSFKM